MKSKLLLLSLVCVLMFGASASAQDPGERDTVICILNIDVPNSVASMELWVWADETITAVTVPFAWDGPPGFGINHFVMDSAIVGSIGGQAIDGDLFSSVFTYRVNNLDSTNVYKNFLFGGFRVLEPGIVPTGSRELWCTYWWSITQWDGDNADGLIVDTATFPNGASNAVLLFATESGDVIPMTMTPVFGVDPSLDADGDPELPDSYSLSQNYPNPFNPSTEIAFALPAKADVKLTIYNILGQEVTRLIDREMSAGKHVVNWDASQNSSGVYFYKIEAGDFTETRKMMLVK
jgi:energy-converting hydrogenase Eha subunit E